MSINELSDSVISFRKVSKSLNGKSIIRNLYLDVPINKSLIIIGRSGAGKSVLLKCLFGIMKIDSGKIFFAGNRTNGLLIPNKINIADNIGIVFQSSALFDSISIWENIAFKLLKKMSSKKAKKAAMHYLDLVGIPNRFMDSYPCELSGGMQRRVSIARAISSKPKFLFFDEPTTGLDPIFSSMISNLIRRCIEDLNATAITITHDIKTAEIIGDNASMIYNGSIVWNGKVNEMMKTVDPYVSQFVRGKTEGPIPVYQI